jgi:serine/threonine-protein kinase
MYPIRYWNPNFSQGLEKIILKCTQLDPRKRYQSCDDVLYDLEHYYELDNEYRKKEKKKLIAFSTMLLLSVATGLGSFFLRTDAKTVQKESFETYIDYAEKSDTHDDKEEAYLGAIEIDPSKADAYIDLLDRVYLDDGVFTEEEATAMRQILITPKNKRTYEQILSDNEAGYALFSYRMGLAYFYSYEGSGNKQQSAYWLNKASTGVLSESQTERAKRLGSIADYYVNLGMVDKTGDKVASYKTFWEDLEAVCEGNICELDNPTTALIIYKEMASQITINADKFNRDGVSYDKMDLALYEIEEHVASDISEKDISSSERLQELLNDVNNNITKARQTLELLEK